MTHELLADTFHALFSSSTEALHIDVNIAFLALTLMTLLFAVMSQAVKNFVALAFAREVAPWGYRARNSASITTAETGN
jgi:hypothetical protein